VKVRIASPITILSGFITKPDRAALAARRNLRFIAIRFCDRPLEVGNTAGLGNEIVERERAIGLAAAGSVLDGNTLSIHTAHVGE